MNAADNRQLIREAFDGLTRADARAGTAEMSKRFHDEGGEIYLPAAE